MLMSIPRPDKSDVANAKPTLREDGSTFISSQMTRCLHHFVDSLPSCHWKMAGIVIQGENASVLESSE